MQEHGQLQHSVTADGASLHQAASNSRTTRRTPQHAAFCRPGAAAAGNFRSMRAREPRAYMCARRGILRTWQRWGSEDAKLLERVFSYFAKKLKMKKSDDKPLKMLLEHVFMYLYTLYFETIIIPSEEVTSCISYSICTNETYRQGHNVMRLTLIVTAVNLWCAQNITLFYIIDDMPQNAN
jgi:hypothetical protein